MFPARAWLCGVLALGAALPLRPCTTFCLVDPGRIVYGRNFDYYVPDGRVMVNRRGLLKTAFSTGSGLQWISRFGSLTFNQFGHEFPNGGINEVGLTIEHMLLDGTQYPTDARPSLTELQWIQYQLDCSATVDDVLASDRVVRIAPSSSGLHFLVADRTGRRATIEFLGGQLVAHVGDTLPVAALTNNTYASSLAYDATTTPARADHVSSLGRFVQAAASVRNFAEAHPTDAVAYAFSALANVSQPYPTATQWSIVYDLVNATAYFRTLPDPTIKQIRLADLDFRPSEPVRMMDINVPVAGLVTPQSLYSAADNLAVLLSVYHQTPPLAYVSDSYIAWRAAYPDSVRAAIPPTVTTQPVGRTVAVGASVTLAVVATGDGPLTFQWSKDGTPLSGATDASISLPGVTVAQAGDYAVFVANAVGSISSADARLTVIAPPTIQTQPVSQTVAPGGSATLSVTAAGDGGLSYQWSKDGVVIAGATAATLILSNVGAAEAGDYTVVVSNLAGSATNRLARLVVATPDPGRLVNVSARGRAGPNGQPMIVGFVVAGGAKRLLVRAVGPGLSTTFNLAGAMTDSQLAVHQSVGGVDRVIAANDNWGVPTTECDRIATASATLGAFPLVPTSGDAAVLLDLDGPGTALAWGVPDQASGVVLLEAYDAGPGDTPRLVNVSARNQVGTGDDVLIAGFVISGNTPKRLLVRGVGPRLASLFAVPGALVDPRVELHTALHGRDTVIAGNDNWADEPGVAEAAVTVGAFAFEPGSKDAALLVTVPAGIYTAVVSGANGCTGDGLVEVYEVP